MLSSIVAQPRPLSNRESGGVRSCTSVDVGSRHGACSTGTLAPGWAGVGRRIPWGFGTPRPLLGRNGLLFDWSFTVGLCAAGALRANSPAKTPGFLPDPSGRYPRCKPWQPLGGCRLLRRFFLLGRPRNVIAGRSCVKARPRCARCYAPASLRSLDTRALRLSFAA